MNRTMPIAAICLPVAGVLCAHFLTAQQLVWAVWIFPVVALAFAFWDMHLAKKNRA